MSVSEEFDFRKKVQEAREKLYKRNAQVLFKEYLIEILNKLSYDVGDLCKKEITKLVSALKKEIKKFNEERKELEIIAEQKYYDENEQTEVENPAHINEMSSNLYEKLLTFFDIEKEYFEKLAFCEEIKKYLIYLEKKAMKTNNLEFIETLRIVIANLKNQQAEIEIEFEKLQELYFETDKECLRDIADLVDALDNIEKGG